MKKKISNAILIFALFSWSLNNVKAQYVTIPDTNFAAWLITQYPSCMNGNLMDTTCSEIVNANFLDLYNLGIDDLTGISYFDNLDSLSCWDNHLITLPPLPNNLIYLECSQNYQLSSLPQLPSTLVEFICVDASLTSLQSLPNSLKYLTCAYNPLTQISNLPDSLLSLQCSNNLLTTLPTLPPMLNLLECYDNQLTSLGIMPNSIKTIYCDENQLGNFSNLSSSLIYLECSENQMTALPPLPSTLVYLNCSDNQISSIPALPDSINDLLCGNNLITSLPLLPNSLTSLGCGGNLLTSLPVLPNNLIGFGCNNNLLSELPELPVTLEGFNCANNNITCFPNFPISIINNTQYFSISNNPATCLPNYLPAMDSVTLAMPLCHSNDSLNNPNNCNEAIGIFGTVFNDGNNNCIFDANDVGSGNIQIKFYNSLNNQFGSTHSAGNGVYSYPVSAGEYMVLIDTLNKPYKVECIHPGTDTSITTNSNNLYVNNVNFSISCKTGYDIGIQSVMPFGLVFPGQQHSISILGGDLSQWIGLNCATGISGQMQITITGPVLYIGVELGALTPTVNGNVFTYSIANFGTINNQNAFKLYFLTDTTAQSGEEICVHVEITPDLGDNNPGNNTKDYCYEVFNSYDPNYKEVYPTDVAPLFQDWLTYTVHFQNLGNAPAINIRVLDTLDANLDAETFEIINYSHYNTVTLMNGILDFRFPNILLPDSASNPIASQGFVQYRIKPKANLIAGTQIENTAHIYFDYNPAVVTNTTVNNFTTTVGNKSLQQASSLWIYPNPSTGIFTISAAANIEVYNLIGELILSENNATSIDLTAAHKGIYFVKLNGSTIKKLIKN